MGEKRERGREGDEEIVEGKRRERGKGRNTERGGSIINSWNSIP